MYMLMELAPGGELYQLLVQYEAFSPYQARFYGGCVVLALAHLHQQGVVFRDLKPENLLLDRRGYVKVRRCWSAVPAHAVRRSVHIVLRRRR